MAERLGSMNRRGYKDEASNTTQWLWNGELTYSFLRGKRGLLKFQVVDILQQRDFVNRWMNDTGQGETWTCAIVTGKQIGRAHV